MKIFSTVVGCFTSCSPRAIRPNYNKRRIQHCTKFTSYFRRTLSYTLAINAVSSGFLISRSGTAACMQNDSLLNWNTYARHKFLRHFWKWNMTRNIKRHLSICISFGTYPISKITFIFSTLRLLGSFSADTGKRGRDVCGAWLWWKHLSQFDEL